MQAVQSQNLRPSDFPRRQGTLISHRNPRNPSSATEVDMSRCRIALFTRKKKRTSRGGKEEILVICCASAVKNVRTWGVQKKNLPVGLYLGF
jgi:hypothetical protein